MNEVLTAAGIVKEIGIPAMFFLVIIYIMFKTVPDVIKSRSETAKKTQEEQREYYTNRQKQYDEQMGVLIRVAEQSTQVISRSNEVISANTEMFKQSSDIHKKVLESLQREDKALEALNHRQEKMYLEIVKNAN